MATRKRRARHTSNRITPRIIEAYTRLRELEAMDLDHSDPRRCAHGEMQQLRHEINVALDLKPWGEGPDSPRLCKALHDTVGEPFKAELAALDRRDRDMYETLRIAQEGSQEPFPDGWTLEQAKAEHKRLRGYVEPIPPTRPWAGEAAGKNVN